MSEYVDFVVGAQYGDEGKGMVAKLIADIADRSIDGTLPAGLQNEFKHRYGWTGRVGAQNAEHRFIHRATEYCARILPSACAFRDGIAAVLGAGHCYQPHQLMREATHMGIEPDRIVADPQAMWLNPEHAIANKAIGDARGTTGWGVGAAIAEKVRRKPGTKLVRDCEELVEWLGGNMMDASSWIQLAAYPGLMEGSQGAMLSLNHGRYPYCTSKDVTVPALAAEMGIAPKLIRHVVGCVRLVQMRVPGPSGPVDANELSYNDVEERTALRIPQHKRLQGDSMHWQARAAGDSVQEERLFELSWSELNKSHRLNGFTHLAITFTDYHRPGNYRVHEWRQLHQDTRSLIEEIENVLSVSVILVRTGQGEHDNIWRW